MVAGLAISDGNAGGRVSPAGGSVGIGEICGFGWIVGNGAIVGFGDAVGLGATVTFGATDADPPAPGVLELQAARRMASTASSAARRADKDPSRDLR